MLIVQSIFEIPSLPEPRGLTLGSFDGMHLGHRHLLKELRKRVGEKGSVALLTFINHPSEVLEKRAPTPPLHEMKKKIQLIEEQGVNLLILLEFSQELAHLSYEEFIKIIRKYYPFTELVLGEGAVFGKNRAGDEKKVSLLGAQLGFRATYVEKLKDNQEVISSRYIRELLDQGEQKRAEQLLGQ